VAHTDRRVLKSFGGRTRTAGSTRKVRIKSTRYDVRAPGDEVATAMREEIRAEIQAITTFIAPTSPGRMRYFANDTGHLARSLSTRRSGGKRRTKYAMLAPADRLDPEHFRHKGENGLPAAYTSFRLRLLKLVPGLGDPQKLWATPRVSEAAQRALRRMTAIRKVVRSGR